MKAVLEIGKNEEINNNLIKIIYNLFQKDVDEIIIRKKLVNLEEYDKSNKLEEVVSCLNDSGYDVNFIKEVETGLKNSSIYKHED